MGLIDGVRDSLIMDAPEWMPSDLPGDGERREWGLAVLLLSAALMVAVSAAVVLVLAALQ